MFAFNTLAKLLVLFQLVASLATVYAVPTPEPRSLERRTTNGMYMVASPNPEENMMMSNKAGGSKSFVIYIKFGDGEPDQRDKQYSTHNPSFVFKGSKIHLSNQAKEFEDMLKRVLDDASGHGGNAPSLDGNKREWYFAYLGTDHTKAEAKAHKIINAGKAAMDAIEQKSAVVAAATSPRLKATAEAAYKAEVVAEIKKIEDELVRAA